MSDTETTPIETRVVDLIEKAIAATSESEKVSFLNQSQELVIHNDMLDNFLDEILAFQNDKLSEVRKFVGSFIEAICKKDPDYFPKVIINLNLLLVDEVSNVMKKSIQVLTQLYKVFLSWISSTKITEEVESTWEVWNQIKNHICGLVDNAENDGVRTQCVKFIEMVIICQTKRDNFTTETDFSLDEVSTVNNSLIDIEALEDEAKQLFEQLVTFQAKIHISSVNLMATMQSLSLIARQRSKLFFVKVINAFEALSSNLPPTLAKSQVNSVNKQFKLLFFLLFKHPYVYSYNLQTRITQILQTLGATNSEINRCIQEVKKKGIKVEVSSANEAKRIKIEVDDDDDDVDVPHASEVSKINIDNLLYELSKKFSRHDAIKATEITAKDLAPRLNNPNIICELILSSLHLFPDQMNDSLMQALKDSSKLNQISEISKHLSNQLTLNGIGPGINEITSKYLHIFETTNDVKIDSDIHRKVCSLIKKCAIKELKIHNYNHNKVKLTQSGKTMSSQVKIKQLKLEDITKPIDFEDKIKLTEKAIVRILDDDKFGHLSARQYETRHRLIGKFLSEFSLFQSFKLLIKQYVFRDIRNRYDILFNTIYFEYVNAKKNSLSLDNYSEYLHWVIYNVMNSCDVKDRDHFVQKFYFESPFLTANVLDLLKQFVLSDTLKLEDCFVLGISLVKSLIEKRIKHRTQVLNILLQISVEASQADVRSLALDTIKTIYQNESLASLKEDIEKFTLEHLNMLQAAAPPKGICGVENGTWNDDTIKVCLSLYLLLLPLKQKLLHELPSVYTSSNPNTKRLILRLIQNAVQEIGMKSPEIIVFVENCPTGSETLVSRVVHILTDNEPPTTELVSSVKSLYQKRVSDVRFLIPVLNGFTKKEIIDILPQLIKLNPNVVKEVFKRILAQHVDSASRPILPADLMIALHKIDLSKCDLKTTIKAINLCFEEKNIYTAEVLAVVLKMLIDQNPLPTLLMRTVIQTLGHYPRLIGFVMNILQRLILKQVWNQKKVWEGFVKCCQRTMPQSFPILLQLPPAQLKSVFETCPEIRPPLATHLQNFSEQQIALIPQGMMDIILKPNESANQAESASTESMEA